VGSKSKNDRDWGIKRESRYFFFLNPYKDAGFTRCPKCENATKVRRFPLLIHIAPDHLVSFNKVCRFCPFCELIIVKRTELESYLSAMGEKYFPPSIGNDYLVIGTLDRSLHHKGKRGQLDTGIAVENFTPFIDHLNFEVRGGWGPTGQSGIL